MNLQISYTNLKSNKESEEMRMKVNKMFKSFFALSLGVIMLFSSGIATFAAEKDTVTFEGRSFEKTSLSKESITWLDWYNSLESDVKEMVSAVPAELSQKISARSSAFSVMESNSDASLGLLLKAASVGSAPAYNPSYWNASSRIKKANCYAYAMDIICNRDMKLQPGQLAGKQYTSLTKSNIITAVKADGPYLGNGRSIRSSSKTENAGSKEYKVALVIAPNQDYHWYIQNKDGYWSHKRGQTKCSNLDASGKKISDPQKCDRKYSGLNYSTWCGYYMVTRK